MSNLISEDDIEKSIVAMQEIFHQLRQRIMERAGKEARRIKTDGSPLTDIDIEVEMAVRGAIGRYTPNIPVLGEEGGYDAKNFPPICWLVDPIDGTGSFLENEPYFTCMAGLIRDDKAVASVIYNPTTDEMFVARKGRGATKNGVALDLRSAPLPHVALCKGRHIDGINEILKQKDVHCEIAPAGGGYGFLCVADGEVAARFQMHSRGNIHDYIPGALLVSEAGGALVPILEASYGIHTCTFVACHPGLEGVVRTHIRELRELELKSR